VGLCCVGWVCMQIKTRDELIIKPLTAQEAGDARDALAKALYSGRRDSSQPMHMPTWLLWVSAVTVCSHMWQALWTFVLHVCGCKGTGWCMRGRGRGMALHVLLQKVKPVV
jgi:hypothetical protein